TWMYRLQRFVARNKLAVVFSAALLASLVAGLVASSWSYFRAEAARSEAAARFDQVRTLAKTMMFDVYDDVARIPGTSSVRADLAATAQDYLQNLAASDDAPFAVQMDAAEGYTRLYTILNREAVADADDRGRAEAAFIAAKRLFESLTDNYPQEAAVWQRYGMLLSNRGMTSLTVDNDPDAARTALGQATTYLATGKALAPNDSSIVIDSFETRLRLASVEKWASDYAAAITLASELLTDMGQTDALNAAASVIAGDALQLRGESHYWIDEYPAAKVDYGAAIAAYERALSLAGEDQAVASKLSTAYWSRGNSHVDTEAPELAALDYAKAVELVALTVARDPDDSSAARRLAILRASQAMALVQSGDADTAVRLMNETNEWFEQQAKADTETSAPQRSLAISYYMMGDIYRIAERGDDACQWFGRALEKWLQIEARFGLAEFDQTQPDDIRAILSECG
ncbi:MAG: hypothetical protein AAGJ86_09295, partial [Pseudomonadota bacterium]